MGALRMMLRAPSLCRIGMQGHHSSSPTTNVAGSLMGIHQVTAPIAPVATTMCGLMSAEHPARATKTRISHPFHKVFQEPLSVKNHRKCQKAAAAPKRSECCFCGGVGVRAARRRECK